MAPSRHVGRAGIPARGDWGWIAWAAFVITAGVVSTVWFCSAASDCDKQHGVLVRDALGRPVCVQPNGIGVRP